MNDDTKKKESFLARFTVGHYIAVLAMITTILLAYNIIIGFISYKEVNRTLGRGEKTIEEAGEMLKEAKDELYNTKKDIELSNDKLIEAISHIKREVSINSELTTITTLIYQIYIDLNELNDKYNTYLIFYKEKMGEDKIKIVVELCNDNRNIIEEIVYLYKIKDDIEDKINRTCSMFDYRDDKNYDIADIHLLIEKRIKKNNDLITKLGTKAYIAYIRLLSQCKRWNEVISIGEEILNKKKRIIRCNIDYDDNELRRVQMLNRGYAFVNIKETDKAINIFKEVYYSSANAPYDRLTSMSNLIELYLKTNQYEEAEKLVDEYLKNVGTFEKNRNNETYKLFFFYKGACECLTRDRIDEEKIGKIAKEIEGKIEYLNSDPLLPLLDEIKAKYSDRHICYKLVNEMIKKNEQK